MAEVRDAAQIDALGAWRISPTPQVLPVLRNVGLKNAVLQPSAGLWLNDDLPLHADLLPSWMRLEGKTRIMRMAEL
jgi:hypothetical protein